ncbi:MAG: S-layer homology domain-containing protein [bacterium]|nr:S-layer homology domain-containing protein [bacterium]
MRAGTKPSTRWAAMVAASMVFSLLALASPPPVGAVPGEADYTAQYSACVGPATQSYGFTDMVGSFAEEAANCLAHYGITRGTTATTYSPRAGITRVQMALFMTRAAGPSGITLPAVRDQGFTDIDRISTEGQAAINQVAYLEIMEGRSPTEFDPKGLVTRADMANHLAAFLEQSIVGPGGWDIEENVEQDEDVDDDETIFEDIDRLPQRTYRDILNLFEMGITLGTGSGRYLPESAVTRAQMAAFIARTLAHTNARPIGLTVQQARPDDPIHEGDTVEFTASIRDSRHRPVEEIPVDFFWAGEDDDPLNNAGECTSSAREVDTGAGSSECEIDGLDPLTNELGNLAEDAVSITPEEDGDVVVWAWTGNDGDEFDEDDSNPVIIELSVSPSAKEIRLTHNAGVTNTVRFGKSLTLTFQLISDDGNRIRQEGVQITWQEIYNRTGDNDSTRTYTEDTDSSGRFQKTIPAERDPSSSDDNTTTLEVKIQPETTLSVVDENGDSLKSDAITFTWSDATSEAARITLSGNQYKTASLNGSNTIRVTVTDQYGSPIGRKEVTFASTETSDYYTAPSNPTRTVNSRGVTDFSYKRQTSTSGEETIMVTLVENSLVNEIVIYWGETPGGDEISGLTVVKVDKGSNTMVLTVDPRVYTVEYDSNDQFNIEGEPVTFSAFEAALSDTDVITLIYSSGDGAVSSFDLTADN